MLLEKIQSPQDLKKLKKEELNTLADEIRSELVRTVSSNGGHLASNLGVVELTIAIHRVFNAPEDKIVFDVGHQSYVHKMITGRYDKFRTLREYGGIAGFPRRTESEYDCFETGHASTAISAALGLARARDCLGQSHEVIAVVGDGALTGGMCYEALNDAGNSHTKMMVILNDNEMSIAHNVGALSSYLTRLRVSSRWQSAKKKVRSLSDFPVLGKPLYHLIHKVKKMLKSILVSDKDIGFFEALGFEYFGPIDGHDLASMERTFRLARTFSGPCVIHVLTKKGNGYDKAEERPETFHGTPPFYVESGDRRDLPKCHSCGHIMAETLADMCGEDDRIIAVTAAMKLGTGLDHFGEKRPNRLIDTGITEEHAATMAAGLAAGGMRPYFAVYSSFFQRCYDQIIHDVCMQNLPVVFLLDRSGIGGEDGQTHHGVFDLSETLPVPGLTVLAPCDSEELKSMLHWTILQDGPCVIRYNKSGVPLDDRSGIPDIFVPGRWNRLTAGTDAVILAVGSMVRNALRVYELLQNCGYTAEVWNCSTVKPLDESVLMNLKQNIPVFTMEENMKTGGFGAFVLQKCQQAGYAEPVECFAVDDRFIQHGAHGILLDEAGLSPEKISIKIAERIREGQIK